MMRPVALMRKQAQRSQSTSSEQDIEDHIGRTRTETTSSEQDHIVRTRTETTSIRRSERNIESTDISTGRPLPQYPNNGWLQKKQSGQCRMIDYWRMRCSNQSLIHRASIPTIDCCRIRWHLTHQQVCHAGFLLVSTDLQSSPSSSPYSICQSLSLLGSMLYPFYLQQEYRTNIELCSPGQV